MADNIEKVNQFFGLCQNKGVDIPQSLRDQLLHQSNTLLVEDDLSGANINDSQISKNVRIGSIYHLNILQTQDFILCLAILIQQNVTFMKLLHLRGLSISDQTMNTVSVAIKVYD